jgi:hypothetical protein
VDHLGSEGPRPRVRATSSAVDFAQDLDAFGFGDAFKPGLTDPLLVKLAVGVCFIAEDPKEINTFDRSSPKQRRSYQL